MAPISFYAVFSLFVLALMAGATVVMLRPVGSAYEGKDRMRERTGLV